MEWRDDQRSGCVIGYAIRSQHRRYRLAPSLGHRDAWDTLNDTRLFHERRIKLRWDPANNSAVVAREARVGWSGGCGAPEVIGGVGEEVDLGLVEERRSAAIALCKDDFVEQFYGGVV